MKNIHSLLAITICLVSFTSAKTDGPWVITKKEKFILYTRPANFTKVSSPDSLTIEAILDEQVECMKQINCKLGTSFGSEVTIYLFNSDEAKEKIGTNGGGYAEPRNRKIYYTFATTKNPVNGRSVYVGMHELVHIVTTSEIGYASSRLMREGYAVGLTGNYSGYKDSNGEILKKSIDMWMKEYISSGQILKPTELINDNKLSERILYPQAGFFINWLIIEYGLGKVNKLYVLNKGKIIKNFENITGEPFGIMEARYLAYCNSLK